MKICWLTTGAWKWSAADGCKSRSFALILVRPATAPGDVAKAATAEQEEEAVGGGAAVLSMHQRMTLQLVCKREAVLFLAARKRFRRGVVHWLPLATVARAPPRWTLG